MRKQRAGFTLIELLVVLGIIMLLAGITLVALQGVSRKKRVLLAKYRIQAIEDAIRRFHFDNNQYPWELPKTADPVDIVWVDLCKELNPNNASLNGTVAYNAALKDYLDFGSEGKDITAGVVKDPWGRDYEVYWNRDLNKVFIWSWGEDGISQSGDDAQGAGDGIYGDDVTNF